MLVNLNYVLEMAQKGQYAIPAFNVYNMESVIGVLEAAEEMNRKNIVFSDGPGVVIPAVPANSWRRNWNIRQVCCISLHCLLRRLAGDDQGGFTVQM